MKKKLTGHKTVPRGIRELWVRMETEWVRIPRDFCVDFIKSISRKVAVVLKTKDIQKILKSAI